MLASQYASSGSVSPSGGGHCRLHFGEKKKTEKKVGKEKRKAQLFPLTVFSEPEQRPLLVLHESGHQLHSQPDDQHPQRGVQQEVHQIPVKIKRMGGSETKLNLDVFELISDSQGAGVLFGERGQEDVGEVDEKCADGLLGRVEEPEKKKRRDGRC